MLDLFNESLPRLEQAVTERLANTKVTKGAREAYQVRRGVYATYDYGLKRFVDLEFRKGAVTVNMAL